MNKKNSHITSDKVEDKFLTNSPIIFPLILLILVIILIIILISISSVSNVDREFTSFKFQINTSLEDINWQGQKVAEIKFTNMNSLLPTKVKIEHVFICINNSQNQELIFSSKLEPQILYDIEYGLFSNIQYMDISAGQTKTIEYMLYPQRFGNEELIELEEQNLLEIEFRSTQEHNWRRDFAREVCLGNEKHSILE
ncbi:MAG: hypothetical protein ACMXYB_01675 [Candidatus Woesearchaeota archaeon]